MKTLLILTALLTLCCCTKKAEETPATPAGDVSLPLDVTPSTAVTETDAK